MQLQKRLLLYGILLVVSLVVSLSACSPVEESTEESLPRISGTQTDVPQVSAAQIEQIRQRIRESELREFPKPMWSAVSWLEAAGLRDNQMEIKTSSQSHDVATALLDEATRGHNTTL